MTDRNVNTGDEMPEQPSMFDAGDDDAAGNAADGTDESPDEAAGTAATIGCADGEEPFEEMLTRLEQIVESMEAGGLSLDESLRLYEEGMKKAGILTGRLAKARERVMKLVGDPDGRSRLETFGEEDDQ